MKYIKKCIYYIMMEIRKSAHKAKVKATKTAKSVVGIRAVIVPVRDMSSHSGMKLVYCLQKSIFLTFPNL
jgi:hypothetical protein